MEPFIAASVLMNFISVSLTILCLFLRGVYPDHFYRGSFEIAKTKSHSCSLRFATFEFVKTLSLACSFASLSRICEKKKPLARKRAQLAEGKKNRSLLLFAFRSGNCNLRLRARPVGKKGSACHLLRLHEFQELQSVSFHRD